MRDVARRAQVSVTTASRALSGSPLVNAATEQRIREAAEALGYRPNTLARGLKTQSSRLIGLMVHNLVATSYRTLAETAQRRLGEAGYQVILCISGDSPDQEARFLATVEDYRAEGLIIVPTGQNARLLDRLERSGLPIVAAIRSQKGAEIETVLQADTDGAEEGTRYLLGLGHRRIGLIVGRSDTTSGAERRAGYLHALADAGIAADDALIVAGPYVPETGVLGCERLLTLPDPPTALFVANHEAAMGVLSYLSEHDIRVPDQLSLLCYEDVPWFRWQKPAISVVDNGAQTIADLVVDALLRRLGGTATDPGTEGRRGLRVGARLVQRDSCQARGTKG